MSDKKRLVFEPDIDLNEDQICSIENEILDEIDNRLGNKYLMYDWEMKSVCTILAKKKY